MIKFEKKLAQSRIFLALLMKLTDTEIARRTLIATKLAK